MARTRSRKRRPAGARPRPAQASEVSGVEELGSTGSKSAGAAKAAGSAKAARAKRAAAAPPKARQGSRRSPTAPTYGERPQSAWHPLPLSELLILIGAIAVVFGLHKLDTKHPEISKGGSTLLVGLGAVAIGTFEVAWREHRSGFRSHTILLSLLPVLVFHSLVVFIVSAFTTAPRLLNVGLLALDIALFAFLFRVLRARFLDARQARVLKER